MQTKENDVSLLHHDKSNKDKKSGMQNLLQFIDPFTGADSEKNLPPAIVPTDGRPFFNDQDNLKDIQKPIDVKEDCQEKRECKSFISNKVVSLLPSAHPETKIDFYAKATYPKRESQGMVVPDFSNICNSKDLDEFLLGYSMDDVGNVERFSAIYGNRVLFNTNTRQWFVWDDKSWQQDVRNTIKRMAEQVMIRYKEVALRNYERKQNSTKQEAFQSNLLVSHSKSCCSNNSLNALVTMLQHHFPILSDEFNRIPYLLNVRNGTIDLRTGDIKPHDRNDFITQYADINYNPLVHSICFGQFIQEIFCYDPKLIDYVQTALGYCITGDTSEQCFFIAYGDGSNGKSTLSETIGRLFKDYVRTIPISVLMDSTKGGTASPEIANAVYSRMVLTGENKDGEFFNEGKLKILTGGNTISARHLYSTNFELIPKFKIWIDTNYLPNIRGYDHGIWRRIKVIPFKNKFDDRKKDKNLPHKLLQDSEAILVWLVQGAIKYYTLGLKDTTAVLEALSDYKESEDTITPFIENCLVISDGNMVIACDLYQAYQDYCSIHGISNISTNTHFGRVLKIHGFEKVRTSKGVVYKNLYISV